MRVTIKPGVWVDPAKMMRAIRDAGFTPVPEDIRMTVTGTLETRDGRFVLVLDRMKTPMELACVAGQQGGPSEQALRESAGRALEVQGRWVSKGAGALEVEAISEAPAR